MDQFKVAYASIRGNMHIKNELPNQDAIDVKKSKDNILIAIADGHGSSVCFRSNFGSKIAVKISTQIMATMDRFEMEDIPRLISIQWQRKVSEHMKLYPFQTKEVEKLDQKKKAALKKNPYLAYGSTLLTMAIGEKDLHVFNIGDGDLLIKESKSGQVNSIHKEKSIGNDTESLSLPYAYSYFTYHKYSVDKIDGMLAATDGYPNSFKDEAGFLKVLKDLLKIEESHGIDAIQKELPTWLEDTSKSGSGDDITACFVSVS